MTISAGDTLSMSAQEPSDAPTGKTTDSGSETYLNPAEPIKTSSGRNFSIRIQSNPTTGYQWQMTTPPDTTVLQLVTNRFLPPESKRLGAGGHELWTFKAINKGQTEIHMQYVRPWEKDQPPAKTNVFMVIVK